MPIVVVHGVNVRDDDDFKAWKKSITVHCKAALRDFVFRGEAIKSASPHFCYWGDLGVGFAWNFASVPAEHRPEAFGSHLACVFDEFKQQLGINSLSALFARPTQEAVGALSELLATLPRIDSDGSIASVLQLISESSGDARMALQQAQSDEELLSLISQLSQQSDGNETFGRLTSDGVQSLARISSSIAKSSLAKASNVLANRYRFKAHTRVAALVGDLAKYMAIRKSDGSGPIQQRVKGEILDAIVNDAHEPLILVAHSLGGLVLADILEEIEFNGRMVVLVTVGSQVSYFEEMKLLLSSDPSIPSSDQPKAVLSPRLAAWINVFDLNDFLSFSCSGVFNGVTDVAWSSKTGLTQAHGAYFFDPSFYKMLRGELAKI